jgi:hypothetical protein
MRFDEPAATTTAEQNGNLFCAFLRFADIQITFIPTSGGRQRPPDINVPDFL